MIKNPRVRTNVPTDPHLPILLLEDAVWGDWPHLPRSFVKVASRASRHVPLKTNCNNVTKLKSGTLVAC
jgi:hypothetical protein